MQIGISSFQLILVRIFEKNLYDQISKVSFRDFEVIENLWINIWKFHQVQPFKVIVLVEITVNLFSYNQIYSQFVIFA